MAWLWCPSGLPLSSPRMICICTFSKLCLSIWLPVSLNLGANRPPLKSTDSLGTPPAPRSHEKHSRLLGQSQRFESQPRAGTGLNDKVHLLQEATPSRLGDELFHQMHRNQQSESEKMKKGGCAEVPETPAILQVRCCSSDSSRPSRLCCLLGPCTMLVCKVACSLFWEELRRKEGLYRANCFLLMR